MFLQRFKTPGIAHVAYLVGDGGEAAVVDPRRDVEDYVAAAQAKNLTIKYVVETHRQEDFVMGSKEVAKLTGAKIVSGTHPLFGHSDVRLNDGEELSFGKVKLRALHTPGHTPESTSYALFVGDAPDRALGVFTGDTLFVGETGRTDLPDPKKTGDNAGSLFDAVHGKLLPLGDQAILWPAHASGSVCGGNIADRDDSTIGIERASNPVFTKTRDAFIRAKIEERIPRPPYFDHMERVNLTGGLPIEKTATSVRLLSPSKFASETKQAIVIDARTPEAFAGGHVPGSLNVWLAGLPVFGGWLVRDTEPVYLVVPQMRDLGDAAMHLARIGIDRIDGVLSGGFEAWRNAGLPLARSATIDPRSLEKELATTSVLDVREDSEFEEEGHIPGAHHLYVGYLDQHLERIEAQLRSKAAIAVTCSVGNRSGVAVSVLERHGLRNVRNLLGGMTAWKKLDLPLEKGRGQTVTTPDVEGMRR